LKTNKWRPKCYFQSTKFVVVELHFFSVLLLIIGLTHYKKFLQQESHFVLRGEFTQVCNEVNEQPISDARFIYPAVIDKAYTRTATVWLTFQDGAVGLRKTPTNPPDFMSNLMKKERIYSQKTILRVNSQRKHVRSGEKMKYLT